MKPTICQLVHGLPIGGTEVLVDRFVRRLSDDYRVVVACLDEIGVLGERLRDDGFGVFLLDRQPGFDWQCVRSLARLLKSEKVQLVHAHQYTPFAYSLALRAIGTRPRILFTEHGRFYPDYRSWKRVGFNRLMTRTQDRFVAVGQSVRQALVENEGLPESRIEVIYNGIQLDRFTGDTLAHDEARAALGIGEQEFVVMQVARLDEIKDHDTALNAISITRANVANIRLVLVGDGPERERIREAIEQKQLGGIVQMLGARDDVPRLLPAANVFLLSSISEGIPVTLIESMAAGIPVVSTSVGGVTEVLDDGRTGLLAPAKDAEQLANCLLRIHENPTLAKQLAAQGRLEAIERFSEETMIGRYASIYDQMLGRTIVKSMNANSP